MRKLARYCFLVILTSSLLMGGCSDDAVVDPPDLGTIAIIVVPEGIAAPWQLDGPGGFSRSGTGAAEFADAALGDYTLNWGEMADQAAPYPIRSSRSLSANATVTFVGVWTEGAHNAGGLVPVAGGSFLMGSPPDEPYRYGDLETQHGVTLTRPFGIGATEVTSQSYADLAQWACDQGLATIWESSLLDAMDGSTVELLRLGVDGSGITYHDGALVSQNPDEPVTWITWYGAAAYCDWRSLQENLTRAYDHASWICNDGDPYGAAGYRLPTEAEWEYACRAGSRLAFANGPLTQRTCEPPDQNLNVLGWYCGNSDGGPQRIAAKNPNRWGLYDLHGNVLEWCNDWLATYGETEIDPAGPPADPDPFGHGHRVARGGGWYYYPRYCRSAYRDHGAPGHASQHVGFRCVRTAPREAANAPIDSVSPF